MRNAPRTMALSDQGAPVQSGCNEETTELQQLMLSMILFIGEVYVELAGHTAAARSVVQDMQSGATLLRSRSDTRGPRPQPWLAAALPTRRASSGGPSNKDTDVAAWDAQQDRGPSDMKAPPQLARMMHLSAINPQALSPAPLTPIPSIKRHSSMPTGSSSQHADPASHPSHNTVSPSPLSPSTPSPPPGQLARGLGGPSLVRQPYPLRRAPSPASAVNSTSHSPNSASPKPSSAVPVTAAGTRQTNRANLNSNHLPSPTDSTTPYAFPANHQESKHPNLSGIAGFSAPSPRPQHGLQVPRRASAGNTLIESSAISSISRQAREAPARPESVLQQRSSTQPPPDSMSSTPAVWSLPIPRPVDLTPSGGYHGPGTHTSSAGPLQPLLGPPCLPPAFRRAVAMYQEAVATSKQLLHEAAEADEEAGQSHVSALTPASLLQHVSNAGDTYTSRLNDHYGVAKQHAPTGNREDPQILLAAIVAAQTWLMQALTELALPGGISSGVSTADIAHLLEDVSAAQLRVRLSSTSLQPQQQAQPSPLPVSQTSACIDTADDLKAAERWRNRFLRTLLDRSSRHTGPEASDTAPFSSTMLRPVGLWLPDTCWTSLSELVPCAPAASASPEGSSTSSQPALLQTWHQAMPCSNSNNAAHGGVSLAEASAGSVLMPARALQCASPSAAAAHSRAQLQLQWHLCQLAWEGGPAARMVPTHQDCDSFQTSTLHHPHSIGSSSRRSQPDADPGRGSGLEPGRRSHSGQHHQQQQQQQEKRVCEAVGREERWLARCRMAHMLLVKGAWNRHCCVSQMVEGDVADEERRQ